MTNQVTYRVRIAAAAATFLTGVSLLAGAGLLSNFNTVSTIAPSTLQASTADRLIVDESASMTSASDTFTLNGLSPAAMSMLEVSDAKQGSARRAVQIDMILDLTRDPMAAVDKDYVLLRPGTSSFTTAKKILIPKAYEAVQRALADVGHAESVCSDKVCKDLCDHVAGDIWGYTYASGYETAKSHWATAMKSGIAHPDSKNVPVGALMFWDLDNPAWHVAVYVGNGLVVGSMTGPDGLSNIYLTSADRFTDKPSNRYVGWAYPVFHGQPQGAAL